MCGIIGYVGDKEAAPLLLNGLKRMEYRGYDSAGICTLDEGGLHVKKDAGKIDEIHARLNFLDLPGNIGMAHTRWATHGGVTKENAHPHVSCHGEVAVVHNGIIENYQRLKEQLLKQGHRFASETDTEIIAHLVERSYRRHKDPREAVLRAVRRLRGAFAFLALFHDHSATLVGVRKDAPLVVGVGGREQFVASDILAFIEQTDRVVFLDNLELAVVNGGKTEVWTFDGRKVAKTVTQVAWEASDISKEEFKHYTIKEIHEQPATVRSALYQDEAKVRAFNDAVAKAKSIYIVASGTSFHAGLVLKYLLAGLAKIRAEAIIASEFNHYGELVDRGTVVIAISQSGETADVLEAVGKAKEAGAKILSVVNVMGSSLVRESDLSLFINCGPEIGVAATKSFTSQLALIYRLALDLAGRQGDVNDLRSVSKFVDEVLQAEEQVQRIARAFCRSPDFYFVGRGVHYPIALEGALKLKELSYVHAEGMPAGELKHGTLALIERGTPAIVVNPEDETFFESLSNAEEMRARGAHIIGLSNRPSSTYDEWIRLPEVNRLLYPIVEVIPLQLLAYYTAVERQQNPDYPRNLAKSVTVK